MTPTRRLARLEKQATGQPGAAEPPGGEWAAGALGRPADEGRELARATAAAFAEMVGFYREHYTLSAQEAIARAEGSSPAALERARHAPPDQVSWFDLDTIARHDPDAALRRWEEIKEVARGELRTGQRAARTVEGWPGTCWGRARFLAVRNELVDSLRPRDATELLLIDQMAVSQVQLWDWQATLAAHASVATLSSRDTSRGRGMPEPPRLTDAEAMEQAAAMVERFQRLFHRALAALQAQRRQTSVVVRRAGQVNVGHQQINVSG
jgi:hypothetical protein